MKRLLSLPILLGIVFLGSVSLVRILPGDPADILFAESPGAVSAADLRTELFLTEAPMTAAIHAL